MALAWIDEQAEQDDIDDAEEAFSSGAPCRGATWEFPRLQRSHDWTWAEDPAPGLHRYSATYQVRLHQALADLRRISSELQELSRSTVVPVLAESLHAAIRQVSTSVELFDQLPERAGPTTHDVIDWRSANREQWSRGLTARVDEDGSPVTLISKPAQLGFAVESHAEEPLLDE